MELAESCYYLTQEVDHWEEQYCSIEAENEVLQADSEALQDDIMELQAKVKEMQAAKSLSALKEKESIQTIL